MLALEEGTVLVSLARTAIESHVSGRKPELDIGSHPTLTQPRGVFVSLVDVSRGGVLRGCIGTPFPDRPLVQQTVQSAVEAASMDPRYSPIKREDLPRIIIEVTVLSNPNFIDAKTPMEIPSKVIIGRHGIVVDGFGSRGLLLPQVAIDEGFDPEEFLSQCCMKAGLLPDAWLEGHVRVSLFEGQVFSEEKPGGSVFERVLPKARAGR
ncbi:MAG TPA: TIGR00296 family protein [Candidatus Bathyarchaeia archaeon]